MVAMFFFFLLPLNYDYYCPLGMWGVNWKMRLKVGEKRREEKTLQGREAEEDWMMNKQHGGEKREKTAEKGEERDPARSSAFWPCGLEPRTSNLETFKPNTTAKNS